MKLSKAKFISETEYQCAVPSEVNRQAEPASIIIQKRLQRARQYNFWIYESITPYLGKRILDVGCSIGNITELFFNQPWKIVVGVDIERTALKSAWQRLGAKGKFFAVQIGRTPDSLRIFKDGCFDTVTCLNVLEHVEDDTAFLKEMWRVLDRDGHLILYVPAFQFLMGDMDRADGHFRRYQKAELSAQVLGVGLRVVESRYMNIVGAVGWFMNGKILRRRLIPEGQLGFFDRLVPILKRIEKLVQPPFGQSLLLIAKKE